MPLVGIGTLPTPFSPASVPLPPETGGRGHTSLRVGGWGKSQFRRGAYTVVLFICTYFVMLNIFEYIADRSIYFVCLVYNNDIIEINHIQASRKINKKSKKFYIKSPQQSIVLYKVRSSPFYQKNMYVYFQEIKKHNILIHPQELSENIHINNKRASEVKLTILL